MTSRSLHRVLTSDRVAKYATVGKFLGNQVVPAAPLPTNQPPTNQPPTNQPPTNQPPTNQPPTNQPPTNPILELDPNLDLLDGLVAETLANQPAVTPVAAPARAKELLQSVSQEVPPAEAIVEAAPAQAEAASESVSENLPVLESTEVQELTKELQEVSKETKEQREQALIQEKQRAINDLAAASATPVAITDKPVVVLPITAKSREEAKFKSTKYSVKWLWEWSQKIIKMFAGAVVYKEEVDEA